VNSWRGDDITAHCPEEGATFIDGRCAEPLLI
jgi:hypothetical protein